MTRPSCPSPGDVSSKTVTCRCKPALQDHWRLQRTGLHWIKALIGVKILMCSATAFPNSATSVIEIGHNHSLSCEADSILTWRSSSLFSITLSTFHQTVGTVVRDGNFSAEIVNIHDRNLNSNLTFVAAAEFNKLVIECLSHEGIILSSTTISIHEGDIDVPTNDTMLTITNTAEPSKQSSTTMKSDAYETDINIINGGRYLLASGLMTLLLACLAV